MQKSPNPTQQTTPCLMQAWHAHEQELRHWLRKQGLMREQSEDFLQEMFLKSLTQQQKFCAIENPRAWCFFE